MKVFNAADHNLWLVSSATLLLKLGILCLVHKILLFDDNMLLSTHLTKHVLRRLVPFSASLAFSFLFRVRPLSKEEKGGGGESGGNLHLQLLLWKFCLLTGLRWVVMDRRVTAYTRELNARDWLTLMSLLKVPVWYAVTDCGYARMYAWIQEISWPKNIIIDGSYFLTVNCVHTGPFLGTLLQFFFFFFLSLHRLHRQSSMWDED